MAEVAAVQTVATVESAVRQAFEPHENENRDKHQGIGDQLGVLHIHEEQEADCHDAPEKDPNEEKAKDREQTADSRGVPGAGGKQVVILLDLPVTEETHGRATSSTEE